MNQLDNADKATLRHLIIDDAHDFLENGDVVSALTILRYDLNDEDPATLHNYVKLVFDHLDDPDVDRFIQNLARIK